MFSETSFPNSGEVHDAIYYIPYILSLAIAELEAVGLSYNYNYYY